MLDVYLDTTIPSFAATARDDPASMVRRELTRAFWRSHDSSYALYVSELVDAEIEAGSWSGREDAIKLIARLPRLPLNEDVRTAAETYMNARLMPRVMAGDAFHVACASVHSVHVLLTWNVRHLANPSKTEHLAAINRRLGIMTPTICTPESLIEEPR